jgi:low affinity Fe/Cu permease
MWITKPIIAFVSGAIFVIAWLLTAIAIAVLLAIDIPDIAILSDAEIIFIIVITTIIVFFSASFYTFQRYAVIQDLKMKLDDRRDMQERIDQLARLRSRAVNEIYTKAPDPNNFETWENEYVSWQNEVRNILKNNFPFAVVEMFTDLGTINPINFVHASSDQQIKAKHIRILRMLVKELAIIEGLIKENTALTFESQPPLLELIKWQEQT